MRRAILFFAMLAASPAFAQWSDPSGKLYSALIPDRSEFWNIGSGDMRWGEVYASWLNVHRSSSNALEQSAFAAKSSGTVPGKLVVGGMFRAAYEVGGEGSAFGLATEVWANPGVQANLIGAEFALKSHDSNDRQLRGIDVVFKDRNDGETGTAIGENRYNENSAAIYISAQPRSTSGEYSGWQSGIKFDFSSLDRTRSLPYAAAIDLTQIGNRADIYFVVWPCPPQKCGMQLGSDGSVSIKKF